MDATSILAMLKNVQSSGISITTETLDDYGLGDYHCDKCNDTGHITRNEDGILFTRECECMPVRRSLRRIRSSGMMNMLERYTFENYQTPDEKRARVKTKAEEFADAEEGWFYIAGRSGSGKSHICTAICSRFIQKGKEVYYMSWRDESTSLKANVNTTDYYEPRMRKLKSVEALYIDDFFKGTYSEADIKLAFEILNVRYNDTRLRTIISSEMDIRKLLSVDEALGGRIYERSRGYVLAAPDENWRLR